MENAAGIGVTNPSLTFLQARDFAITWIDIEMREQISIERYNYMTSRECRR